MAIESFSFDKGVVRKKTTLFLDDGEVYTCEGFSFEHGGILEARTPKKIGEIIDVDED